MKGWEPKEPVIVYSVSRVHAVLFAAELCTAW